MKRTSDSTASMLNARCIATTGEIFGDGKILEVVSDSDNDKRLSLASWDGRRATIGQRFECGGRVYEPATIDPGILQALRFPKGTAPFGSAGQLLGEISATVQDYTGLAHDFAILVAHFGIGSWLVDTLPTAPRLSILGPETVARAQLLRLLNCICRHALTLTEVDVAGVSSLPMRWRPTLLIEQPTLSVPLQRLLSAARKRNIHVLRRDRLVDMFCAVATFTELGAHGASKTFSGIEIPVGPPERKLTILNDSDERKIAEYFQAKLLRYRFANHSKVLNSTFDPGGLTFPVRELATSIGRCTPDDTELQQQVIRLLTPQDAEIQSERWTELNTVVIEALLAACHEAKKRVLYVAEIAEAAEVILMGRGENRTVGAREVGARLRLLGLATEPRDSRGFRLCLTEVIRRRVHELAHALTVPTLEDGVVRCVHCKPCEQTSEGNKRRNDERRL
jgi:hypothetical protein